MAKISANYEVVYILDPAQGEEAIAANVAKFQALAEQHGCSDVVVDEWGKRRLAYAMLRKLGDGSFNQFLPGLQSFGFGSFCHD